MFSYTNKTKMIINTPINSEKLNVFKAVYNFKNPRIYKRKLHKIMTEFTAP